MSICVCEMFIGETTTAVKAIMNELRTILTRLVGSKQYSSTATPSVSHFIGRRFSWTLPKHKTIVRMFKVSHEGSLQATVLPSLLTNIVTDDKLRLLKSYLTKLSKS